LGDKVKLWSNGGDENRDQIIAGSLRSLQKAARKDLEKQRRMGTISRAPSPNKPKAMSNPL
jgi:hypothetical protein